MKFLGASIKLVIGYELHSVQIIAIRLSSLTLYLLQTAAYRHKNLQEIDFNYFKCFCRFLKEENGNFTCTVSKPQNMLHSTNVDVAKMCRLKFYIYNFFKILIKIHTKERSKIFLYVILRITRNFQPLFSAFYGLSG